jgi:predicted DNA binding protein
VREAIKLPIALTEELLSHAELVAGVFLQAMYTSIGEKLLEELAESDLTYSQMQALRYLNTHKRVTVGDLAEGLNISYPSATNMVHRLGEEVADSARGEPARQASGRAGADRRGA